jgi:hypothetical protein
MAVTMSDQLHPGELPAATPMIISESPTHIVVALEISKAMLAGYRRFFEALLEAADGSAPHAKSDR